MLALSLPPFSLPLAFMGQTFEWGDMVIVGLLVLLEGVLSIDNALVLGLLAKRLPPHQRPRALSYGLIGAFVFRVLAIATASFLLKWTFVKLLGGGYLIFIAVKHLFFESQEEDDEKLVLDASGHPVLVDVETGVLFGITRHDFFRADGFKHLLATSEKIFEEAFVIVVVADRGDELRDTPGVFLRGGEADVVFFPRHGFALHHHGNTPRAGARDAFLEGGADARGAGAALTHRQLVQRLRERLRPVGHSRPGPSRSVRQPARPLRTHR
jgi:hypothetical protein